MQKILAFAGSRRSGSFNQKLVDFAAGTARDAGADVTVVNWSDFPMPLYDAAIEAEGIPQSVRSFQNLLADHAGFLISAPEYNSSITPLLKNAIDWASRPIDGEPSRAFRDKVASLVAASPGRLGGLRGLVTLRSILGNMGVLVTPTQVAVPLAHEAFDESGTLKDERLRKSVANVTSELIAVVNKLRS